MTKDLIATFGKSDGGTHNWKYKDLDPNLTAPQIKEACELLTNLDICTQNGVKLFDSVVTAKVLTYKETLIFDPEHETRGVRYDGEPAVEEPTCEEVRCFEVAEKQEKPTTVATSKSSVLPATPRGRYFKQLTTIETLDKPAIKVEKESLPQPSYREKHEQNQPALPLTEKSSNQDTIERSKVLQWLHRIRKKNKEGPSDPPRE